MDDSNELEETYRSFQKWRIIEMESGTESLVIIVKFNCDKYVLNLFGNYK